MFAVAISTVKSVPARAETTNAVAATLSKSRVVLVRDPDAVSGFTVDAPKVRAMVVAGMKALTGQADVASSWRTFVSSNDVVGIKINIQGAPLQATRPAVVDAIVDGLRSAGVAATNIIVWDRDPARMASAGYVLSDRGPGPRVVSVLSDSGWDAGQYYESKVVGKLIWGDWLFGRAETLLSTRSHLPKVMTQTITKLVNVPVLQDNDPCGLSGCLYNISLGAVDNNRRFETLGQKGDPMIAAICALPAVRRKLVLNICDALIGGYAGGSAFRPQYSWAYGGLYLSADPVAVDVTCLNLLEARRREAKITPIGSRASYIATAGDLGLGQANTNQIDLVRGCSVTLGGTRAPQPNFVGRDAPCCVGVSRRLVPRLNDTARCQNLIEMSPFLTR